MHFLKPALHSQSIVVCHIRSSFCRPGLTTFNLYTIIDIMWVEIPNESECTSLTQPSILNFIFGLSVHHDVSI